MAEYSLFAREDSNTANNAYLTVQGNSDTVELTFVDHDADGLEGDLLLDYNSGNADPDTMVLLDGTEYSFTVEYIGTFINKKALENVNGLNLNQQEIDDC